MTIPAAEHWNTIFRTKASSSLSWAQEKPTISLNFIKEANIPHSAKIIDVGGGDSNLVDYLLEEGYTDVTVLDLSETALQKSKERLGPAAKKVTWIVSDVLDFKPKETYAIWHDRAAFHFQTDVKKIEQYVALVQQAVQGQVILGTFSHQGPMKCSGLEIKQYDEQEMQETFEGANFTKVKCQNADHLTPSGVKQSFLFCRLAKRNTV